MTHLTKKTPNDFWWITKLALVNPNFVRTTFFKISLSTGPQQQVFNCITCQKQRVDYDQAKKTWICLSSCSRIWGALIDYRLIYRLETEINGSTRWVWRLHSFNNFILKIVKKKVLKIINQRYFLHCYQHATSEILLKFLNWPGAGALF